MTPEVEHLLQQGLQESGLVLPQLAEQQLCAYLRLLEKWNRIYNLTAIRDVRQMVTQHVHDSLSVLPYVQGVKTLADVGSGAGLPGIPLAIACPELAVTLIETNSKKTSFLQQVKIELKLDNLQVHTGRVEDYQPQHHFERVISRAFADLTLFVRLAGGLLQHNGRLLAMKGQVPDEEIASLPNACRVDQLIRLQVPGLEAERHLLVLALD